MWFYGVKKNVIKDKMKEKAQRVYIYWNPKSTCMYQ